MRKYVNGDTYKLGKVLVKRTRTDGTVWKGWVRPLRIRWEDVIVEDWVGQYDDWVRALAGGPVRTVECG